MAVEAAHLTRKIQREVSRRYVDASRLEVYVSHDICYMRGFLRKLRNHPETSLDQEIEVIKKMIRHVDGIRDVVWEVEAEYL